jgi:hypothetical protein
MVDKLRTDLLKLVNTNNDTIVNIKDILSPIAECIDSPIIASNLNEIVTIIMADRDNNNKFDTNDLKLLSTDTFAILNLTTIFILLLTAIPSLKITVNVEDTEIIVLKMLLYVFLIIIPQKTGDTLTIEQKTILIDSALNVYQTIKTLSVVKTVIAKIAAGIKSSKFCKCVSVENDLIDENLPEAKIELAKSLSNAKNNARMNERLDKLERKIK